MTHSTDIDTATIAMTLRQRDLRNQSIELGLQRRAQNSAANERRWERKRVTQEAMRAAIATEVEKRKKEETRALLDQFGSSGGRGGSRGW